MRIGSKHGLWHSPLPEHNHNKKVRPFDLTSHKAPHKSPSYQGGVWGGCRYDWRHAAASRRQFQRAPHLLRIGSIHGLWPSPMLKGNQQQKKSGFSMDKKSPSSQGGVWGGCLYDWRHAAASRRQFQRAPHLLRIGSIHGLWPSPMLKGNNKKSQAFRWIME